MSLCWIQSRATTTSPKQKHQMFTLSKDAHPELNLASTSKRWCWSYWTMLLNQCRMVMSFLPSTAWIERTMMIVISASKTCPSNHNLPTKFTAPDFSQISKIQNSSPIANTIDQTSQARALIHWSRSHKDIKCIERQTLLSQRTFLKS